jgi:lipoyl(octanoyl) transferase
LEQQFVQYHNLGVTGYQKAWDFQEQLLSENVNIKTNARKLSEDSDPLSVQTNHHLILCEHPPVLTLGKSGSMENVLADEHELKSKGIEFYRINRGGDITFHGPGQLVGYPILDLEKYYTDIGRYLRNLEETIILTIGEFGINGERSKGETGVWIDTGKPGFERKICAMGVRCSRWITMHGFALNVNTDLSYFDLIVPCGIKDKKVTSMEKELGRKISFEEVKSVYLEKFAIIFDAKYS